MPIWRGNVITTGTKSQHLRPWSRTLRKTGNFLFKWHAAQSDVISLVISAIACSLKLQCAQVLCWIRVLDGFPGASRIRGKTLDGLASDFIAQSNHVYNVSYGDRALVYCISFPFPLPFEIRGWAALFIKHFTSVGLWPSFKWNLLSKLKGSMYSRSPPSSDLWLLRPCVCAASFVPFWKYSHAQRLAQLVLPLVTRLELFGQ